MSAYEQHFRLHDEPFRLTPDPRYLFLSEKHREVLAHLRIGTSESGGFVCITGDVGTGKTTVIRSFLDQLEPGTPYAYIFNPPQSPLELLQTIITELGLPSTQGSRKALVDTLNTFLLEQRRAGRRALVVVDEAQALPPDVLEELRLLSNLETTTTKLLQIVLFGQPQLADVLRSADLAQLNQRITLRWHLGALNSRETAGYVRHRLRIAAGGIERTIFSSRALARIHTYSGGVPRLINILCHRGLLAAYADERQRVTTRTVERIHEEIQRVPLLGKHKAAAPWRAAAWAASGAALAAAVVLMLIRSGTIPLDLPLGSRRADRPQRVAQDNAVLEESTHPEGRDVSRSLAVQDDTGPGEMLTAERMDASGGLAGKDAAAQQDMPPSERTDAGGRLAVREDAASEDSTRPDLRGPFAAQDFVGSGDSSQPESTDLRGRLAMIKADTPTPISPLPTDLSGKDRPESSDSGGLANNQGTHDVARRSAFEVARMLLARTEAASTTAAVEAILQRWDEQPLERDEMVMPMDLDAVAAKRNLHYLSISGTVSMLRILNLPAILELVMPGAVGPRYAVLSSIDNAACLLAIDGNVLSVERSFLDEYWLGQAHIVWRDFEGLSPSLAKGTTGGRVRRLQEMLAQLTFYTGPITGIFDDETEMAVASFQRSRRLFADAIVGRLTRIVLYDALGNYKHPRLISKDSNGSGADA